MVLARIGSAEQYKIPRELRSYLLISNLEVGVAAVTYGKVSECNSDTLGSGENNTYSDCDCERDK